MIRVGDVVRLKKGLEVGKRYDGITLLPGMKSWFDKHKTAFVIGTAMGVAWFEDSEKRCVYSFEMLEKV